MNESTIRDICAYMIENINEDLSISDIADIFHYNKFYLIRKFKETTGFTMNEFINQCRIYNSIDPLVFTDDTILKIALSNGFNSLEYYSERFKDTIGSSPNQFRQVFSVLANLAETTDDVEVLEYVRDAFDSLKEYQNYLSSMGEENTYSETASKPKVKVLKTTKR